MLNSITTNLSFSGFKSERERGGEGEEGREGGGEGGRKGGKERRREGERERGREGEKEECTSVPVYCDIFCHDTNTEQAITIFTIHLHMHQQTWESTVFN